MPSLGCQVNRITGTRGAAGVANGALASGGDTDQISGNYISTVVGVRIATPLFGTGFNFCVGVPSTPVEKPCYTGIGSSLFTLNHIDLGCMTI